jgi:hypothetical protein
MTAPRGFRLLVAAATLIGALMLVSPADAQVFKPRGKTALTGKAPGNAAVARKAAPTPTATVSKKSTRATGTTTRKGAPAKKRHGKGRTDRDDDVKIQDDDDDVKITDD